MLTLLKGISIFIHEETYSNVKIGLLNIKFFKHFIAKKQIFTIYCFVLFFRVGGGTEGKREKDSQADSTPREEPTIRLHLMILRS